MVNNCMQLHVLRVFTNLDITDRKYSNCAMSFTFEPVPINLLQEIHGITFPQRQLPVK